MKLRLSLTVHLTRDMPQDAAEQREIDDKGFAFVERSEPQRVGFVIDPYQSDPFEEKS